MPRPHACELLLGYLADRVGIARVQRRGLGHHRGAQFGAARPGSAARTCPAQGRRRARAGGRTGPCVGAVVAALAVDDHRGGEHQARYARGAHRLQQHGRARHVDIAIGGQVGQVDAEADQGGLMADRVDAVQRPPTAQRVADIGDDQLGRGGPVAGPAVVHGRGERVQAADVVPGGERRVGDVRADEAGRAGDQDVHVRSETRPGTCRRSPQPDPSQPVRVDRDGQSRLRCRAW